jgi:hypothetical protein
MTIKGKLVSYKADRFIALNGRGPGYEVVLEKRFLFFPYRVRKKVDVDFRIDMEKFIGKKVCFEV